MSAPQKNEPMVTFFVPCLNEEANIQRALGVIVGAAGELALSYEILVFDDCSDDATLARVAEFQAANADVSIKVVANPRRMGLGYNYVEGAFVGKGRHYMLINGDGDMDQGQISKVLSCIGQADLVIPYLAPDNRGISRRFLSSCFTAAINLVSGQRLRYYNGPVLHQRRLVMRWHPDTMGFAYQAELLTRLLGMGYSYVEVGIANSEQGGRVSKALSVQNLLSVSHSVLQIGLRRLRKALFQT
jgi:glycosyltransferase involved in cell wall biosynthesis